MPVAGDSDCRSEKRVEIRWQDLDPLGHVHHATFLALLEEGRDAFLREALPSLATEEYVIARCLIDYRCEVRLDARYVRACCRLDSVGNSSIKLKEKLLTADGSVAADAEVVLVLWDPERRMSRPLRADEHEALTGSAWKR